jgi:retron-type reverse transcriptase
LPAAAVCHHPLGEGAVKQIVNALVWICTAAAAIVVIPILLVGLILAAPSHWYSRVTGRQPGHWLRTRFGKGKSPATLARWLDVPLAELQAFTPSYREATIPKRSGGVRRLAVPSDATKSLQRRLAARVLARLRAHAAASAYERGRSIATNAAPHVGRAVVIKLDVVDFFTSTTTDRVRAFFQRIGWNREAAELLTRFVTHEGGLPQGAPTSPRLSNLVNFGIDVRLAKVAARYRGSYTRYADDITFSFPKDYPRHVRGVIQKTRRILKAHGYELHQKKKLRILRRHHRQLVTGLVVNERINLPRKKRRELRAALHRLATGRRATLTPEQLAGWKGLLAMVSAGHKDSQKLRAARTD